MLSIFLIVVVMLLSMNFMFWEMVLFAMLIMLVMILKFPIMGYYEFFYSSGFQMNNSSFLLLLLCLLSFVWASMCAYSYFGQSNKNSLVLLIISLMLFLIMFFFSSESLNLYIMFELAVLPIFMIIIGWGYQSERLEASLSLLFYTITASLPLLGIYLWMYFDSMTTNLLLMEKLLTLNNSLISKMMIFCLLAAFLVKLPMYGVHLWLPKAHVEAPVFGSMILAAILLKLGSFGMWLFIPYVFLDSVNIFISMSLVGGVLVSILCLRLTDLKMIIAYSSVSHMGCVLIPIFMSNMISSFGGMLLMLAHGISSSAMFLMSYYLYQNNYSRSLLMTKGLLVSSSMMALCWFLILMINMAAPPTMNLLAEILVITSSIYQNKFNFFLFILIIVVGTAYSLIMFSSSIQGNKTQNLNMKVMNLSEIMVIFNHLVWGFLLILVIPMCNI